jgi:tRNA threonylcarbamoyladenosine biosynthesis protein TsaE
LVGRRDVAWQRLARSERGRRRPVHTVPSCPFIESALHLAILETRVVHWPDEAACAAFARALAQRPGTLQAFIELRGPLGAGKTTFVRHLLQSLGVEGRIKSPTYALMEPYELSPAGGQAASAWHFDFYRFDDAREWEDAGFRDIFATDGLKLAEWPEQADGLLPEPDLCIEIVPLVSVDAGSAETPDDAPDAARDVRLTARSPLGLGLLP